MSDFPDDIVRAARDARSRLCRYCPYHDDCRCLETICQAIMDERRRFEGDPAAGTDTVLHSAFEAYRDAKLKVDTTLDMADGLAARRAWLRFLGYAGIEAPRGRV